MYTLKEAFGKRLQEIRKNKNLTQEKFADMLGMDIPNISNIERGKKFVSSATIEKLVKVLDISPKELFDFEHIIKSREELIEQINLILAKTTDKQVEFYYKMIVMQKEI